MYCKSIAKRFGPFVIRPDNDIPAVFYVEGNRCAPFYEDCVSVGIRKNLTEEDIARRFNRWLIIMTRKYETNSAIIKRFAL